MLFVVCCLRCVVSRLLFGVVRCSMFAVGCVLSVVDVCEVLSVICCSLWFAVCRCLLLLVIVERYWLVEAIACCWKFVVRRLLLDVRC